MFVIVLGRGRTRVRACCDAWVLDGAMYGGDSKFVVDTKKVEDAV